MSEDERVYRQIEPLSRAQIGEILGRDDPRELYLLPVSISLFEMDEPFAEALCVQLASHDDEQVRGNAILGFSHLARRFGFLTSDSCKTLVEAALKDPSEYVRGQADATADDLAHYLAWKISGRD